jgi:aspartate racemase
LKLGILGGMGPFASAELLHTIYRLNMGESEQGSPAVFLYSDPTIPDRTTAILNGDTREVAERITHGLRELERLGADRIVMACVTAHDMLPQVPEDLRGKVTSLFDLMADELLADPVPGLLLSTTGTRKARIFERHPRWPEIEPWLAFLEEDDLHHLHSQLYGLKKGIPGDPEKLLEWVGTLPGKYGRSTLLFGCTELHLLHRAIEARKEKPGYRIIDPLYSVARDLGRWESGRVGSVSSQVGWPEPP